MIKFSRYEHNGSEELINSANNPISNLKLDNDKCFLNKVFISFILSKKITLNCSVNYEHYTNGASERTICSIKSNLAKFKDKGETETLHKALDRHTETINKNCYFPNHKFTAFQGRKKGMHEITTNSIRETKKCINKIPHNIVLPCKDYVLLRFHLSKKE
uniref:Integrase catalytic domain-containing protein n=1 Tax=Strongyloides papillosus TaxID=174720 RepID=A0A0N5BRN8_STREA